MTNYNQPYLEKYSGRSSRHECPACGDHNSFVYYLDGNTGRPINEIVGRCNHESGCGYHYTPKQFFTDNPVEKERFVAPIRKKPIQKPQQKASYIPFQYVERAASYNSSFVLFLCGLFDRDTLESPIVVRIMEDYALGATKDGCIIYWQIDIKGRVRTGKVMRYDPETGHRIKDSGGINWIHAIMKRKGLLPEDFNLSQCLFGEHLLKMYPTKVVALVESEKTALVGSGVYPEYIWLATGGKSQLSIEKMKVLHGRTVLAFPDVDGFNYWKDKAKELESMGFNILVSDILEKNASDQDRIDKIDLADWLIRDLMPDYKPAPNALDTLLGINPVLKSLIETFDLKLIV